MKKILVSIALVFVASMAFSQDHTKKTEPKIILKIKPLRLAEPHSTIVLGVEYKVKNKLSIQNEIGLGFEIKSSERDDDNRNSFRFNTAVKYYFRNTLDDFYVSIDAAYLLDNYDYESIEINKNQMTVRAIFGYQKILKRFVFDAYLGAGAKFENTNRGITLENEPDGYHDGWFTSARQGKSIYPAVALGFKIGYLIK